MKIKSKGAIVGGIIGILFYLAYLKVLSDYSGDSFNMGVGIESLLLLFWALPWSLIFYFVSGILLTILDKISFILNLQHSTINFIFGYIIAFFLFVPSYVAQGIFIEYLINKVKSLNN